MGVLSCAFCVSLKETIEAADRLMTPSQRLQRSLHLSRLYHQLPIGHQHLPIHLQRRAQQRRRVVESGRVLAAEAAVLVREAAP